MLDIFCTKRKLFYNRNGHKMLTGSKQERSETLRHGKQLSRKVCNQSDCCMEIDTLIKMKTLSFEGSYAFCAFTFSA